MLSAAVLGTLLLTGCSDGEGTEPAEPLAAEMVADFTFEFMPAGQRDGTTQLVQNHLSC